MIVVQALFVGVGNENAMKSSLINIQTVIYVVELLKRIFVRHFLMSEMIFYGLRDSFYGCLGTFENN